MASDSSTSWTCPNCAELIEPQFDRCWKCGSDKDGRIESESSDSLSTQPVPTSGSGIGWSVFAFVVFWPLGLMALVLSILGEVAFIHGDVDKAKNYSADAGLWRVFFIRNWFLRHFVHRLPIGTNLVANQSTFLH